MNSASPATAFATLGIDSGASITEIRSAYLEKTSAPLFSGIFLENSHLNEHFCRVHEAYIEILEFLSETDSVEELNIYPPGQLIRFYLNRGLYFLIKGDYQQARQWFEKGVDTGAADSQMLIYLGILYLRLKNLPVAEKYFGDAAKMEHSNCDAWFYFAETVFQAGKYRKARTFFETALMLEPERKEIAEKIKQVKQKIHELYPEERKRSLIDRFIDYLRSK